MTMVFTAPYSVVNTTKSTSSTTTTDNAANEIIDTLPSQQQLPFPNFCSTIAKDFVNQHGFGVKNIAIRVENVYESFTSMIKCGAEVRVYPQKVQVSEFSDSGGHHHQQQKGYATIAEVNLYGDVNLRLVNTDEFHGGTFLPYYQDVDFGKNRQLHFASDDKSTAQSDNSINSINSIDNSAYRNSKNVKLAGVYGFTRFDHVVGNLWSLEPKMTQIKAMTGFHEFAEFVAEDVGTVESGLNSVVLANNNEYVLLPLNEPTFGTKRKSQIQTYLEQNNGEGVQHIAMFTTDIFRTLKFMNAASYWGGFEFMDSPGPQYYQSLRVRLGDSLTEEQYTQCEALGILADKDDGDGVLLQIFTKPVSDRATLFLEVIQRIGCMSKSSSESSQSQQEVVAVEQKAGCGGFGKGNFKDLFKSIEEYEKKLGV